MLSATALIDHENLQEPISAEVFDIKEIVTVQVFLTD